MEFFVEEDRPKITAAIQTALATGFVRVDAHFLTIAGPKPYEFNGVLLLGQAGAPLGIIGIGHDITERILTTEALQQALRAAESVLARIKQLQGLLPICSYCKTVRDDKNYWQAVECYVAEHSEARFSHGICPTCMDTVVKRELAELDNAIKDGATMKR